MEARINDLIRRGAKMAMTVNHYMTHVVIPKYWYSVTKEELYDCSDAYISEHNNISSFYFKVNRNYIYECSFLDGIIKVKYMDDNNMLVDEQIINTKLEGMEILYDRVPETCMNVLDHRTYNRVMRTIIHIDPRDIWRESKKPISLNDYFKRYIIIPELCDNRDIKMSVINERNNIHAKLMRSKISGYISTNKGEYTYSQKLYDDIKIDETKELCDSIIDFTIENIPYKYYIKEKTYENCITKKVIRVKNLGAAKKMNIVLNRLSVLYKDYRNALHNRITGLRYGWARDIYGLSYREQVTYLENENLAHVIKNDLFKKTYITEDIMDNIYLEAAINNLMRECFDELDKKKHLTYGDISITEYDKLIYNYLLYYVFSNDDSDDDDDDDDDDEEDIDEEDEEDIEDDSD